jgi:hypothetical protein
MQCYPQTHSLFDRSFRIEFQRGTGFGFLRSGSMPDVPADVLLNFQSLSQPSVADNGFILFLDVRALLSVCRCCDNLLHWKRIINCRHLPRRVSQHSQSLRLSALRWYTAFSDRDSAKGQNPDSLNVSQHLEGRHYPALVVPNMRVDKSKPIL